MRKARVQVQVDDRKRGELQRTGAPMMLDGEAMARYAPQSTMTFAGNGGAIAPAELGLRLGISGGATTSLLSMLAQEGKVRICLAELPLGRCAAQPQFSPSA